MKAPQDNYCYLQLQDSGRDTVIFQLKREIENENIN